MTLNLLLLFAPLLIIGIIFVIVFTIQDRKQAKQK
jgi:hypothetical protein